jgi:hypothetical protein
MKLTLEPCAQIDIFNGQPARQWEGVDDAGVPVKAWIVSISPQTNDKEVNERFAAALREQKVTARSAIFDARFIL